MRIDLQAIRRHLMLTADDMVPPGLAATRRLALEHQMLELLLRGSRFVLLSSTIIGPLLAVWLTLPYIGVTKAWGVAALLFAISLERVFFLSRARERARHHDVPARWAHALAWRAGLSSVIIAVWFHFVVEAGDEVLVSQMLALLTILAAGAAAQFSCWPPVMWAVVSPLLLGMTLQMALMSDVDRRVEAVFCFVLWMVLVSGSLRSARTLHRDALTRLENEDLMRELHDKHAQAEAANAAKSRFFAAANHDLRQPLQAMALYLNLLQPRGGGKHADDDILTRMRQCMRALDHLLASLLDFSRMDSGQITPERRAIPLQPLFEQLAGMHEAMARQNQLQLRVHATTAWAHTDPVLLERAVSNLLANALRYTEQGGVLLGARRRGSHVCICVVDTGVGIPEDAREIIYEEFVQLHNPGRDAELGHGLGLATVRRIATLLGHRLDLRSRVGKGSIFTLALPAAAPESTPAPGYRTASTDVPAPPLRGKVLVVEDNAVVRDALVQQLTGWGLQVQTAGTGEAACAAISRHTYDAVLSDWRLPGSVDGLAVLRAARARLPQLRLSLLITGEDTHLLEQLSPEFPVLRKPLRPLRLRTMLARHLKGNTDADNQPTHLATAVETEV